jgi:branched-chain amino acid transport system ATP-binding protein
MAAAAPEPEVARPLLSIHDLHVYLGGSHVLQGVTFDVPEGGVTALLGRNGVGKTTTVRAILGLTGRRGSVTLAGEELTSLPTHKIVRRGFGYVPEDRDVFTGLTVEENLRLAERDANPRYDLVYELFPELKQRAAQRAGTLSGGQQQMVAIARALLNDNRVLLVDEPTKGLAPALVSEVARVLERLSELTTVLLVEQNLGVVRRIARDVIVLDQGRVVHAGGAKELLERPELVKRLLSVTAGGHDGRRLDGARQGAEVPAPPAPERE